MVAKKSDEAEVEFKIKWVSAEQALKELYEALRKVSTTALEDSINSDKSATSWQKKVSEWTYKLKGGVSSNVDENTKLGIQLTGEASKASGKIGDDIMKIMKTGIGIIEDIHARIKQASPLLQSVESLFNLAMQLFFMPLGNKLAQVMLPAILQLVDDVMAMWDKIEGMDLGEMLNTMIDYGVKAFGQYFQNLGDLLVDQGGILGSLGNILNGLGSFIENNLADLINMGVNILKFIMDNFGTLVNAFIEFKILSLSLQVAQLAATMAGPFAAIAAGAAAGIGTFAAANVAVASTGAFDATAKMNNRAASGMYVGATEGGRDVTIAEGGEGEFILPESRLQSMMDSVSDRMVDTASSISLQPETPTTEPVNITNHYYFNGLTLTELKDIIKQTVDEQISLSKLRSGY